MQIYRPTPRETREGWEEPSVNAYAQTFSQLRESAVRILQIQYSCPGYGVSMKQLARMAGYKTMHASNAHYGRAGHWLSDAMGILPAYHEPGFENWWSLVSDGCEDFQEFLWVMRPNAVRACEELGWQKTVFSDPSEITDGEAYKEGKVILVTVLSRERDNAARQACIRHYGWKCQVCGFDFAARYGEIGRDFIHVHHRDLMAGCKGERSIDPASDLIPVCPNCHSMFHRRVPPYTPEELRQIMRDSPASLE